MSRRVAFHTFGCRLNQAETAALQRAFERRRFEVVGDPAAAELVVVNTCTVTANGDSDTRKLINRLRRGNPEVEIALVGCQAQMQAEALSQLPNVSYVVGNADKMILPELVETAAPARAPLVHVPEIPTDSFTITEAAIDRRHTRANLKIQDGCDFCCFFCVIPYARGRARSRDFGDLLRDARELLAAGHREIVLTGVNIGTYDDHGRGIVDVVGALCRLSGLARLRISSIEPTTVPTGLLDLMADDDSPLCRHLHLPIQSGNDDTLFAMNRKYTVAEYRDFLSRANDQIQGLCLGTDVIVGYPGETDEHFERTEALLRELPFAYLHVFSYSERTAAKSRLFDGQVGRPKIDRRSRVLRELSQRKRRIFHEQFIGETLPVLFERQRDGWWSGVTDNFIRVKVRSSRSLANQLEAVRLTAVDGLSMRGEPRP